MTRSVPVWKWRMRWNVNADVPNISTNNVTKGVSLTRGTVSLVSASVKTRRPEDNVWRHQERSGTVLLVLVFVKLQRCVIQD